MGIVEKLRRQADSDEKAGTLYSHEIAREAADEIERLRAIPTHWQEKARQIVEIGKNPNNAHEAGQQALMLLAMLTPNGGSNRTLREADSQNDAGPQRSG